MIKIPFIAQILGEPILNISSILMFVAAFFYCAIAYIFYKTIDGTLRRTMMYSFFLAGVGMFLRGIYFYLPLDFRVNNLDLLNALIILPVLISGLISFFYLYYTFCRKDKDKDLEKHLKSKKKENKNEK